MQLFMMRQIVLRTGMSDAGVGDGASGPDLALYIDRADVVLLVLGADGRIRFINQRGCDLLGYPRDRMIGMDWFEICIPETDREVARLAFRRSLSMGYDSVGGAAETVVTRSGSLRRIVWRSSILRDPDGAVLGAVRAAAETPEPGKDKERGSGPSEYTGTLLARHDFAATTRLIFDSCRNLVGAQAGFLVVFEGGDGASILDPGAGGHDVESSLSALIEILCTGSYGGEGAMIENDLPGSRWAQGLPSRGSVLGHVLVAPLVLEGTGLGLLGLACKPGGFTDADASLAAGFADLAVVAFSDAETRRRLLDSERRYHTLAGISPVGIFRADRSGDCVYVNPYWSAISGVPFEEALGKGWERSLHPEDRERVLAQWRDVIGGKCEFQEEYRVVRPDGTVVWVLGSGTCETHPDGEPIGYVRTVIDITDRKKVEIQQQEHLRFLQQLMDAIPNPIFFKDAGGIYIGCNRAFEDYIGLSRDRIIGKSVYDIAPPDFAAVYEERDRALFARPGVQIYESRVQYADGSIRDVLFNKATYVDASNQVSGLIGIILDITERKRDETALKTANNKLNLLASITRHDILNQLTVLLGSLTLLLDDVHDPDVVHLLSRSRDAARTIERQILFTRDYQDIGMNAPRWFNVGETVRIAAFGLPEASKILSVDVGDLEVYADPLLQKVFYNLMENALRHGGAITRIGVSAEPSGKDVVQTFEDDGVGIPEGKKEQIFRREYYVNTGLGLFLSREILAITGIVIRETGTPGKGARFELLVPAGGFRYGGKVGDPAR